MPIANRELSQFGSFLNVDDTTRNIGIATTATPYVGIGTTNPIAKFSVVGDTNLGGNLTVGVVTATKYYGDGSTLTNVVAISTVGWIVSASGITTSLNVGIGTTIPTSKLTVVGDALVSGALTVTTLNVLTAEFNSGIITATKADSDTINARSGGALNYSGFTVGRTGADGRFSVVGSAGQFANNSLSGDIVIRTETTGSKLLFNNGANNAALAVYNNNVLVNTITANGSAPLQVSGNAYVSGNLGIGSPSPTSTLSVVGTANISGNVITDCP